MKKIYENDEEFNFIGAISRELTGYDPDNLLKEMEDAERQWKKEQQEHPEEAKAVMQKAETDFKKLMECIRKTESVVETSHGNKREECLEEIHKETADATEILEKVCVTADGAVKRPEAARKAIAEAAERPEAACKTVEEAAKRPVAACKAAEEAVERSVAVCKGAAEAEERLAAAYKGMAEAEERLRAAYNPVAEAAEQPEKFCETAERATEISDKLHKTIAGQATDGAGDEGCIRAELDGEGYTGSTYDGMRAMAADRGNAVHIADTEQAVNITTVSGQKDIVSAAAGEGYTRAKLSDEHSIADIPDKTYPEQHRTIARPEHKMPIPIGKKTLRKVAILTAAAMILGVGGMASVARQGYRVTEYPEQYERQRRNVVRNNIEVDFLESEIEEAYRKIGNVCGIKVVAFDYIPANMELDDFLVSNNKGIITLCYDDKKIHLEQKILDERNTVSVLAMDRKQENIIQNEWLGQELYLEENVVGDGLIEYSTQFDTSSATYYLSGIMQRDEFIKVVESLYFWN